MVGAVCRLDPLKGSISTPQEVARVIMDEASLIRPWQLCLISLLRVKNGHENKRTEIDRVTVLKPWW